MSPQEIQLETTRIASVAPNFSYNELKCPCCGECRMDLHFLLNLQLIRDFFKFPLVINSSFRCKNHNEAIGGKSDSQHLIGKAADISLFKIPTIKMHDFMKKIHANFEGIGIAKTFVHVDTRTNPAHWVY